MQAQSFRTEQNQDTLTAQQSLQSVQTLLRAGLGCITYLRNLLPTDNFSESYLTSSNTTSSSINGSFASDCGKRNVSGFKIMTVTRGYTEEADKLLDYLEHGVFDALQKQYLRSFIFAVYLDNQDPNNIVEAYTFNFQYYNVPGTDVSIPVMTLGDDLMRLSISGTRNVDPVADATKKGKVPTLGEVKRSLKSLIKNLIQATTQMDTLPKRRYATFKLFYYEHTPDNYEPPHFRAGDVRKDKWFFLTHDCQEVPEKCSIGQVQTGWHGVNLQVASVSGYLPSTEDNNAPFCGTTANGNGPCRPPLTPAEETTARLQQIDLQKEDALKRKVAWDAEEGLEDPDAEGEADNDGQILGIWTMCAANMEFVGPIGMRDGDGNIVPLPLEANSSTREPLPSAEALFQGVKEVVPRHVGQLKLPAGSIECTQTQRVDHTQACSEHLIPDSPLSSPIPSPSPSPTAQCSQRRVTTRAQARAFRSSCSESSLPPSDLVQSSQASLLDCALQQGAETIDTQMLSEVVMARRAVAEEDAEMLDMNTQMPLDMPDNSTRSARQSTVAVLSCECGVAAEDSDCLLCEGGCNRWFHVWCMGFHSCSDSNLPESFICFDCRVRADQNWDLIMVHDLHPRMMAKFRDLALFRRAIKICETSNPEGLAAFTKVTGCESIVAGQLFKRLETEGFIALESKEQDDLGLMETNTRCTKSKKKKGAKSKSARRKTMQKQRYVFICSIINTKVYQDYFNPSPEVERRILGLDDLKPKGRSQRKRAAHDSDLDRNMDMTIAYAAGSQSTVMVPSSTQDGSQTQPETQMMLETQDEDVEIGAEMKRKTSASSDDSRRTAKKVKISIGPAVDLGD